MEVLIDKLDFVESLASPLTPYCTIHDLRTNLYNYTRHIERNRDSLIHTGYPATSFEAFKWLDWNLSKTYFVKFLRSSPKWSPRERFNYLK